jgi:carbamoyl-phosphate synthase small subunit
MTGYVESLTDPSYTNQILVFTYPLIGNYGVQLDEVESSKIQVSGVIVSEMVTNPSHSDIDLSLIDWLESQNIPFITNADTREITKYLRSRGTMLGSISDAKAEVTEKLVLEPKKVSIKEPVIYNDNYKKKVILVDCGAKDNILRSLLKYPLQVKKVPYDYDYSTENYDAVLISNGPGDPMDYGPTIKIAKKALKLDKPIFGICLGTQIMALAAGAKTYKLPFGHRGHNQPCMDLDSNRCYITSQNHGYAISEKTLPRNWKVSFRNLNDGSVEGVEHKTKPFFSVQFHPEASPGPTDTEWLFERFYKTI